MKTALLMFCGVCLIGGTIGCRSGDAVALSNNRLAAYQQFQGQQREIENFYIKAEKGQTITITGVSEMRVATEATPLHALPQSPTVAQTLIKEGAGVLKSGVQFAAGAYVLDKAFGASKKDPIVVEQPEPIMIEPHIVEIPAGAGGAGILQ